MELLLFRDGRQIKSRETTVPDGLAKFVRPYSRIKPGVPRDELKEPEPPKLWVDLQKPEHLDTWNEVFVNSGDGSFHSENHNDAPDWVKTYGALYGERF